MAFHYDGLEQDGALHQFLELYPEHQEAYTAFEVSLKASVALLNNALYLSTIDAALPIAVINIMVDRMNSIMDCDGSKYAMYRSCEDYLVKTDWFFGLSSAQQYAIRFDFYTEIIMGIHDAFYS